MHIVYTGLLLISEENMGYSGGPKESRAKAAKTPPQYHHGI